MADVLNAMGHQNIAGLQLSFAPAPSDDDTTTTTNGAKDTRQQQRKKLSEEDLAEGVQLDIRLTPSDQQQRGAYARSNGFNRPRVFSQLVASRGDTGEDQEESEDVEMDEAGRRIRRSAYEPVTKRYLPLPLPPSQRVTNHLQLSNPPRLPPPLKLPHHLPPTLHHPRHLHRRRHHRHRTHNSNQHHDKPVHRLVHLPQSQGPARVSHPLDWPRGPRDAGERADGDGG